MKKNYRLLVISDDYDEYLIKENYYESIMNYHEDEPTFSLTIREEVNLSGLDEYDIIVIDFGLIGEMNMMQVNEVYENNKILLTSAMGISYNKEFIPEKTFVDFRFELMYIDLLNFVRFLEKEEGD